ncbi:MAG: hypothetical protein ACXWUG_05520 [Polyangiales bacterium]
MEPIAQVQLAIEAGLGALCILGYRTEANRGALINRIPAEGEGSVVSARVVGQGEWIVLGSSEEESFESMSASPTLLSAGFELDLDGRRVEIAPNTKVETHSIEGARRAPLDAMTTAQGMKTRFTFEVRPGTLVYTDAALPQLHAYRAHGAPNTAIVLAGTRETVVRKDTAFPGCWIFILVPGVFGGLIATLAGGVEVAWVFVAFTVALLVFGYVALPSVPQPR